MSRAQLSRETFELSRDAEYFSKEELTKQTTQPVKAFGGVILKELIDNGLDRCEYVEVAPAISIGRARNDAITTISVADNADGIEPEKVGKILNFATRTSDKAVYRSPTRGAQGNALKTIVGIPYALGSTEPLILEARGVRHIIRPLVDPAGKVRMSHVMEDSPGSTGTKVTADIPSEATVFNDAYWASAAALFNPHALVKIERFEKGNQLGDSMPTYRQIYKPTAPGFKKYVPQDPTSPHWYGVDALAKLIGAHVGQTWDGGEDKPLGKFVTEFKGLTSSAKAKKVTRHMGGIKYLSDFAHEDGSLDKFRIGLLLEAMKAEAAAPTHKSLGRIGRDHFEHRFQEMYTVKRFFYRHVNGHLQNGLPYIFEFAVAEIEEQSSDRHLFYGVNHSPTFDDPLTDVRFYGPRYQATGIEEFLEEGFAHPAYYHTDDPEGPEIAGAVHIITPAPMFTEKGKTKIDIKGAL